MLLLLSEAAARADADTGIEGGRTSLEAARASISEKSAAPRRRGGGGHSPSGSCCGGCAFDLVAIADGCIGDGIAGR